MSKGKLADCLEVLGPGHESECAELERRERQMLARLGVNRSNQAVASGALVVKAAEPRLPEGWRVSPAGTYKKKVADRRAILWERGGEWLIQLIELGLQYVHSTGRSRFKNSAQAAQMAEEFLTGVGGEFMPLAEGREAARLGGGVLPTNPETPESNMRGSRFEMTKPTSLKSIIRRSVGIPAPGSRPPTRPAFRADVSGPLRRVTSHSPASQLGGINRAVDQALEPLRRSIETLAGQVAGGGPSRDPTARTRDAAPSYGEMSQLRKSGAFRARSAPRQASPSGGYIARAIPNSSDGLGRANHGLTVRSAVRRNMGLAYRRPVEVKGRTAADAIKVESVKHALTARAKAEQPIPNLVSRTYGNPLTGQKFATPQAAECWTEANQKTPTGVPYLRNK